MKYEPKFTAENETLNDLPNWVPDDARTYLAHVGKRKSMRQVARQKGGHASTISRHVQRLESKRDEPLVDAALQALEQTANPTRPHPKAPIIAHDAEIEAETKRILRRLCETNAFLIVAPNMDKAAVMREVSPGKITRVAVLDQHVAQAFALKDWIECYQKGKVRAYRITFAGKSALKRILAKDPGLNPQANGFAEAPNPFQEQHKEWAERSVEAGPKGQTKRIRYNLAESPVTALGRRKGSDGQPFLSDALIGASERLREDFELAQMGARVTQNWDRFLTLGRSGGVNGDCGPAEGPRAARERVSLALKAMGPGLGDIALRCCCHLEGLEAAEKRMGWSARSGKIVLRIALQRLKLYYDGG
jgi:hypothetical protein